MLVAHGMSLPTKSEARSQFVEKKISARIQKWEPRNLVNQVFKKLKRALSVEERGVKQENEEKGNKLVRYWVSNEREIDEINTNALIPI